MEESDSILKLKAKVIGSLQEDYIDILVGYNLGQLNGGVVWRVGSVHFPLNCSMPNTHIMVTCKDPESLEILKIEPDNHEL